MKPDWEQVTVGDIATLQRGFDIPVDERGRGGKVPVISSGGRSAWHNEAKVVGQGVLVGRKGTLGSVHWIDGPYWPNSTCLWVKDFHGNDPRFVYYFFKARAAEMLSMDVGAANPTLNRNHVHPLPAIKPPKSEQRAIAQILGALDDKIELNRRMNATLEAMAQAVFKEWFVARNAPGGAKEEWEVISLGEQLEVVKGLSYKGSGLVDAGRPMHNLNSIYEFGRYKYEGIKYYTGEFRDRHNCKAGDVIVANTEQGFDHLLIGSAAIVPKRFGDTGIFTHHIYRVRPLPNSYLTNHFIYLLLSHPFMREQVQAFTNGTTVNGLAKEGLERPTFNLPPKALVEKFDAIVAPLYARQEENYEETQTLAALRDTLLPKLMRGEVRVKQTSE